MTDWRGLVILMFSLGVSLLLLALRRERELLAWVCLTVGINVFDARIGINLPAARAVGLLMILYIPLGAFYVQRHLRSTAFRLLLAQIGYLLLLGFIFGILYPWQIHGFNRGWEQSA